MSASHPQSPPGGRGFATTRWTLVLRARGDAPEARAALGELCDAYWTPVYRFLRLHERFREAVRSEIGHTVHGPAEITEELRYLIEVLS